MVNGLKKTTLRKSDRKSEVQLVHNDVYWPGCCEGDYYTLSGPQPKRVGLTPSCKGPIHLYA